MLSITSLWRKKPLLRLMNDKVKNDLRSWLAGLFSDSPSDIGELLQQMRRLQKESGLFDDKAMYMIEGVIRMSKWQARDVMIPKNDIIGVYIADDYNAVLQTICEHEHSRYPVFDKEQENIIGILLAKDLLIYSKDSETFSLPKIMREPNFEPLTKRLDHLLEDFRVSRQHLVVIVDEYELPAGIVTIEDVLERIVGEIEDEFDDESDRPTKTDSDGDIVINGAISVEEFNAEFNTNIPEDGADTVAGWMAAKMGHLPQSGESHESDGFIFKVQEADDRRVYFIKVCPSKSD